jgi:hypothetical protein
VTSMTVKLRYGVRDDGSAPKDTQEFVLTKAGDGAPTRSSWTAGSAWRLSTRWS